MDYPRWIMQLAKRYNQPRLPLYIGLVALAVMITIGLSSGPAFTGKGWASMLGLPTKTRSLKADLCTEMNAKEFSESQLHLSGTIDEIDIKLERETGCSYIFQGIIWSDSPSRRALIWIEVSAESGEWQVLGEPEYNWI